MENLITELDETCCDFKKNIKCFRKKNIETFFK